VSHVSKIEIEIRDLHSLKLACERLGFQFLEGQKTYRWYGKLVSPERTPLPEGITENDLGKCHHAIRVPSATYEIGVVQHNGKYLLLVDYWDSKLRNALGGESGGKLKQAYAVVRTIAEARKRKYTVIEQKTPAGIRLILSS